MDYNARFYSPYLGRFISPDTIVPDPVNPQGFNRYSYVYNNPLKFVDPNGHEPCGSGSSGDCLPYSSGGYTPCLDKACNWSQLASGKAIWKGEGPNPATQGHWSCADTLANCHKQGAAEGSNKLKQFDNYEKVDLAEIEDLGVAIKEDLENYNTSLLSDAVYGAILVFGGYGGRYGYDTPLWNGYQFDATICVGEQGCWTRTEVNYIAQGMWGAAGGRSMETTLMAPQLWNQIRYGHPASEGELFWTQYGYRLWWQLELEENPRPIEKFQEGEAVEMEIEQ